MTRTGADTHVSTKIERLAGSGLNPPAVARSLGDIDATAIASTADRVGGTGKDFITSRNMLSPLHCFQIVTMLVRRHGARIHQFPPQERDVAPRGTFQQARIVFGGDAPPLVPSMDNDNVKTKVFRQHLPGRPLVKDGQYGV